MQRTFCSFSVRLVVAEIGLVRRTLGKVMGGEVISTDTGTRLVSLFARDSQREVEKYRGRETSSQRQRVIRVRHGATARLDL